MNPVSGSLDATELPEVLVSISAGDRAGRLRLRRDDVDRDLYIRAGALVWAESSAPADSLEWLLFTAGIVSQERYSQVRNLIDAGMRRGRALIESGCLTPAGLCDWAERRARFLAGDALAWRHGTWDFIEGDLPPAGSLMVKVDVVQILLAALRREEGGLTLSERIPALDMIPAQAAPGGSPPAALLPHESYVASLADGRLSVSDICAASELPEMETLRTLAVLKSAGILRPLSGPAWRTAPVKEEPVAGGEGMALADLPAGDSAGEIRSIIRLYNELYAFVYAYMIKEVGPIAEQLLEKNLREVRDAHAALFGKTISNRDGSLPEESLTRNLNLVKQPNRRDLLVRALSDYLQALMGALRRILGAEHASAAMRRMREFKCTRI